MVNGLMDLRYRKNDKKRSRGNLEIPYSLYIMSEKLYDEGVNFERKYEV
jgi:hypothetical protein